MSRKTNYAKAVALVMQAQANAPLKFDGSKIRLELIPPEALFGEGQVLTFGAKKYAAGNWANGEGFEWSRLSGGALRHILAWANGEDLDPESGLSHIDHARCMLGFLSAHIKRQHGTDDRVATGVQPRQTAKHARTVSSSPARRAPARAARRRARSA